MASREPLCNTNRRLRPCVGKLTDSSHGVTLAEEVLSDDGDSIIGESATQPLREVSTKINEYAEEQCGLLEDGAEERLLGDVCGTRQVGIVLLT